MKTHPLEPLINTYLSQKKISEVTRKNYQIALKYYVMYLKKHNIKIAKTSDLIAFRDERRALGFSSAYTYIFISAIKGLYKYLKEYQMILNIDERYGYDMSAPIKNETIKHHLKKQLLTLDEARHLLICTKHQRRYIHHYRDHAIISLMMTSGLSTHDIIHAKKNDFMYKHDEKILYIHKKGQYRYHHKIELSDGTYEAILSYLLKRNDDNPYLFMSHRNVAKMKHVSRTFFKDMFPRVLKSCGFQGHYITPHALRHSAAIFYLSSGASLEETKALLRHKKIHSTEVYTKYLSRLANDSESKIESLLLDDQEK